MQPYIALLGIPVVFCGLGLAQDNDTDRVVVPARNTTHARKVDVNVMGGSITVKAYSGKEVIVEARNTAGRNRARREDRVPEGMHRIDGVTRGLSVEEENNVVTVRIPGAQHGDLTISVPPDTSLTLHTMSGEINVEGVKGELAVDTMNGKINLKDVSGSVLANTMNGAMTVVMDAVDAGKPLSFTSMNGTIDVTLPASFKSNVKMRTDHGAIYSDFDFQPGSGGAVTQKNDTPDGRFKVKIDRTISGTINGGGTETTFKTYNGTIYLRKKK
ncbi:MAG: DUF4097 family beta strand repeat-containing protein [Candidatus Solibacter sp.]